MPLFIHWSNLAESLWSSPGIREHIKSVYRLPEHAEDRTSFLRALNLAFRKHQPAPANPFFICPTNREVFKAAVWAIGSNMRPWDQFLAKEPKLRNVLFNYDFTRAVKASSPHYVSRIAAILGGLTGTRDAVRMVNWARMLATFGPLNSKSYYSQQIQPIAKTILNCLESFRNSLWRADRIKAYKGFVLNCDPHYAAEITAICLADIFSNPLKRWKDQGVEKWPGMGFALGMEFIRNLGWPGFKPDRHVIRLFNGWGVRRTYKSVIEGSPAAHFIGSVIGKRRLSSKIFHALLGLTVSPPPSAMHPSFSDNLIWLFGSEVESKSKRSPGKALYITSEPTLPHPFYKTKVEDCSDNGRWHEWVRAIEHGIFRDMTAWVANPLYPLGKERVWPKLASLDAVLLMPSRIFREVVKQGGVEPVRMPEPASEGGPWWQGCEVPSLPDIQLPEEYDEASWPLPPPAEEVGAPETRPIEVPLEWEPIPWPDVKEEREDEEELKAQREEAVLEPPRPFGPPDMEDSPLEDESILRAGPYHGLGKGAQKLIIEPYGMYVPSLREWAEQLPMDGCDEWTCIRAFVEQNPRNSGPAILLFPDAIATISSKLKRIIKNEKLLQKGCMPDGCTATMSGLRMIFFHEVGHHIFSDFQYGKSQAEEVYYEALANWFAHTLLAPWEQKLLKELSYTQPPIYRAYLGLLFMENGVGMKMPFRLLVNHAYAGTLAGAAAAMRGHLRSLMLHSRGIATSADFPTELAMAFRLVSLL